MNSPRHLVRVSIGRSASAANPEPAAQPTADPAREETITPSIDIHEANEGLILEADLPGVTDEAVTVQVEDNVLTLEAEAKSDMPPDARPIHEEYRVGHFQRSFILSEVNREQISA